MVKLNRHQLSYNSVNSVPLIEAKQIKTNKQVKSLFDPKYHLWEGIINSTTYLSRLKHKEKRSDLSERIMYAMDDTARNSKSVHKSHVQELALKFKHSYNKQVARSRQGELWTANYFHTVTQGVLQLFHWWAVNKCFLLPCTAGCVSVCFMMHSARGSTCSVY